MKAHDMILRYQEAPDFKTLEKLAQELVIESRTMMHKRRAKSNTACAAILRELDDKWRAFASKCPEVNPEGFRIYVHHIAPTSKHLLP